MAICRHLTHPIYNQDRGAALFGRTLFAIVLLLDFWPLTAVALPQSHPAVSKDSSIDIVLRSPVQLTPSERRQLRRDVHVYDSETVAEIVRELYQNRGYFKAQVRVARTPTPAKKAVVIQVDLGKQYHLVGISWQGNAALSQSDLANLIPFEPGELFNRTKIAEGLNAAKKLYDSRGYINFTVIPTPLADDDAGTVAFEMDVYEGGQFRFGELDVQGMEQAHRQILLSAWQGLQGRPYNAQDADEFFNHFFRSPRPHINPANLAVRRIDERNRSVNYSLQFVPWIRYRITKASHLEEVENP
jgi:outer membrane translocation and assembly module TamA